MSDAEILAKLDDLQALACTLWGEARSQKAGRIAIGGVIRNRLRNYARYEATERSYRAICLAPKQFSCWNPGADANHAQLMALAEQVTENLPTKDTIFTECLYIAAGIIGGQFQDWSQGSTFYLTAELFRVSPPSWASRLRQTVLIESHVFFSEVQAVH